MPVIEDGQVIPPFTAHATNNIEVSNSSLLGKKTILYFYPKDNTPGCTQEGQDFRDAYQAFQQLDCQIFGVSRDSLRKHDNFRAKYDFPFELISDSDETLCQLFDVIKLKKLYGREYMGIERSTFLIDAEGKLAQRWRKVKVGGHVDDVLAACSALD